MLLGLLAAASVSAAPVGAAETEAAMPAYPRATSTQYEGEMKADGVPLSAVVYTSRDDIKTVLGFYRDYLKAHGRKIVEHMYGPEHGYVGFLDIQTGEMRMAIVYSDPTVGSVIILSAMNPVLLVLPTDKPDDLPMPPEAVNVTSTEGGESHLQRTLHYEMPGVSPKEARGKLIKDAATKGWKVDRKDPLTNGNNIVFKRGAESCVTQIHPADTGGEQTPLSVSMVVFSNK